MQNGQPGYRAEGSDASTPARVRYSRLDGTRLEKFAALDLITSLDDVDWEDCFDGWSDPLLPQTAGDYFSWPALTDLLPWQHSGLQFKRTWPIAPDRATLAERWTGFINASDAEKPGLFRESRDREVGKAFAAGEPLPRVTRFAYRSLDRQYMLGDYRLGDFLRPVLWNTLSDRQLFLSLPPGAEVSEGPAAVTTHLLPDLHHFRGSFGGRDQVPLWRDAACTQPNLPEGLLDILESTLNRVVSPEDLFAYCYAVLAAPSFTSRFAQELETPSPHIPITTDSELFGRATELGAKLIWLHTYGERFVPPGHRAGKAPQGAVRYTKPIPQTVAGFPEHHSYDPQAQELRVGEGVFAPIAPKVRAYSVSGLDVIGSWLDYRMKKGAGRRSSKLDEIRPTIWPEAFTTELLELLWVIEHTVELGPELDETLDAIVVVGAIPATDLPQPSDVERQPPD